MGLTTTYIKYDADGRLLQWSDPNSNVHATAYDSQGRSISQSLTSAAGGTPLVDSYTYDLTGNLLQHVTSGGTTLNYTYDDILRLSSWSASAAGASTPSWTKTAAYGAIPALQAGTQGVTLRMFGLSGISEPPVCASLGREQFCQEVAFDVFDRVLGLRTLDGNNVQCLGGLNDSCSTQYSYTSGGVLDGQSALQDGTGGSSGSGDIQYAYDGLKRPTGISSVNTPMNTYAVPANPQSLPASPEGGAGLVTTSLSPMINSSSTVALSYDINDHVVERSDAAGVVTNYLYDDFGNAILSSSTDTGNRVDLYDNSGNLLRSTDAKGGIVDYTYDSLNRMTSKIGYANGQSSPNDSVTYVYDEKTGTIPGSSPTLQYLNTQGRLTSTLTADNLNNKINAHYTYDFRGWVLDQVDERIGAGSSEQIPPAFSFQSSYSWGNDHQLLSLMYQDGKTVTYQYASGAIGPSGTPLPSAVVTSFGANPQPIMTNITYFADGKVQGWTFGNGDQMIRQRNKRGEVISVVSGRWVNQTLSYGPNQIGLPTTIVSLIRLSNKEQTG